MMSKLISASSLSLSSYVCRRIVKQTETEKKMLQIMRQELKEILLEDSVIEKVSMFL